MTTAGGLVAPAQAAPVQALVRATPGLSLATLLQEQPPLALDVVYTLIAHAQVYVDLCGATAHRA